MAITMTTGFFPVADLPAAQLVSVRVYVQNLETKAGNAVVEVSRQTAGNRKERVLQREIAVPGNQTRMLEVPARDIEGHAAEVTVTLSEGGFLPPSTGMVPGVAVVSEFTGDRSISLLQWIASSDFALLPAQAGKKAQ